MAWRRILHVKVLTLGIMALFFHTYFRIDFTCGFTEAGAGIPSSMRTCKQILYADLELHFRRSASATNESAIPALGRCRSSSTHRLQVSAGLIHALFNWYFSLFD
jgi:hypothetical protein